MWNTIVFNWVLCDFPGCGEGTPDFEVFDELQQYLNAEGWLTDGEDHLCPLHAIMAECAAEIKPDETLSETP